MSIIDNSLQLASAQVVTASAATTNVVDAGATKNAAIGRDIGSGEPLYLEFNCSTTCTASGSATVTVSLQDSADNSTFADVLASVAVPKAELVAGKTIYIPLPPGLRRYVRGYFTVATGPLTAGAFNAQIVDGANYIRSYPDIL